ncbi:MAG: hypothetical protein JWQ99_1588 [Blastococcus sp.]|nr:hypothetical protein [Blastococcus sp.]
MTTVQLRRYWFESGHLPAFLDWFPTLLPARETFGFRVLFAYADPWQETFTWAVELDGDVDTFLEVEARYAVSPERTAAFENFPGHIARSEIGFVEDALGS